MVRPPSSLLLLFSFFFNFVTSPPVPLDVFFFGDLIFVGNSTERRVKNAGALHRTFNVEPLYLQHENSGRAIDYMVRSTKRASWPFRVNVRFGQIQLAQFRFALL